MTIERIFKEHAAAEFDRLAAERESEIRAQLASQGRSAFEIETMIDSCRAGLAEQRTAVIRNVPIELMKAGVPLGNFEGNDHGFD